MKRASLLLFLLLPCCLVSAADAPLWLRYPAISPDGNTIVFTYRGDLYKVSAKGGTATQLTMDSTQHCMPVWSHDGRHIVFAGNPHGNFDLFIMPAAGGAAKRLTWHSADEYPYDLSKNDSTVIFGAVRLDDPANRQFPSDALQELYQVPTAGGRVTQLLTTPAEDAKLSTDGRYILYHDRKGRENIWRKHQISSIARDIWLYDSRDHSHRKLTAFRGEDRSPVWNDASGIYYLSERNGSFNIYSTSLQDTSSLQVTFLKDHPVRFLSISRNGTLCFGYNGEIYRMKKNGQPEKVRINIPPIALRSADEKIVKVADITEMTVSPSGKELAFISRGEVFVGSVQGNIVKRITHTAGTEADVHFSPDGKYLLYASERNGRWGIYRSGIKKPGEPFFFNASGLNETPVISNVQENYQPALSPDGKEIAYIENRATLKIYNLSSRQSRTIIGPEQLYSRRDRDQYFEWSPDGRLLLVKYSGAGNGNDEAGIISTSGKGTLINLTQSGYNDTHPKWVMNGKMMTWYTDRNGQYDVYALFFDEALWKDFNRDKVDTALLKEPDFAEKETDWNALGERKARLTVHPSLLGSALLGSDGEVLYYLAKLEKNYDLWSCHLRTKETKMVLPLDIEEAAMEWDKEKKFIYILADGKALRVDPVAGKKELIALNSEMKVNTADERKNMFEYVWRRTKETFYTAGMHGVNWDALKLRYAQFLPHIDNNHDFSEMLNELLGELNVSHTGASFRDDRKDGDKTASLGIFTDQAHTGPGIKVQEVMKGGPLDDPSFNIKPGTIIEAVDGEMISADKDVAAWFNGKAGKKMLLTVRNGDRSAQISVKPVTREKEFDLLYDRWVKRNEAETNELGKGQLGYVHLYRMNDAAYRHTYEEAMGKYPGRKGLVVDTRFNRGGDLASELVMFLSGAKTRNNTTDRFLVNSEPSFRWTKPSVVLACEANYSDGQCFVYDYQTLKMGKLVGMPVPGSCTWMTGQTLQDPTMYFSVPTLGVKDLEGKYLENVETMPDIEVMNTFDTVAGGRDQQLEAAIRSLMKDLTGAH